VAEVTGDDNARCIGPIRLQWCVVDFSVDRSCILLAHIYQYFKENVVKKKLMNRILLVTNFALFGDLPTCGYH